MLKKVLVYCVLLWIVLSAGLFAATTERKTSFSYYLTDDLPYYDISLSVWFSENSDGSTKTNEASAKTGEPSYYVVVSSGQAGIYDVTLNFGPFKLNDTDTGFSDYSVDIRALPAYEEVKKGSSDDAFYFEFELKDGVDFAPGRKATKIYAVYYDLEKANLLMASENYESTVIVTVDKT